MKTITDNSNLSELAKPKMLPFLTLFGASLWRPRTEIKIQSNPYVVTNYFGQFLDHANQSIGTFQQRYLTYLEYDLYNITNGKNKTKNVILYIAGESDGLGTSGPSDFNHILAQDLNARVITFEHRMFGESHFGQDSKVETLQYLTVRQVLDDMIYFRDIYSTQNSKELDPNCKWIAVGGSYSGLLSALLRRETMDTDKFHAAIASSGVVYATDNFVEFDTQDAISMGQECAAIARETRIKLVDMIEDDETYNNYISSLFGVQGLNKSDFYFVIGELYTLALQYGKLGQICAPLLNAKRLGGDTVAALAKFSREFFIPTFYGDNTQLIRSYDRESLKQQEKECSNIGGRAWLWMTCNELAYWQVSPGMTGLRPEQLNQEYFREQCRYVFGEGHDTPNVAGFNERYGGFDQTNVTRVIYTTSSQDPWTWACVNQQSQTNEHSWVHTVTGPEMGHCSDLGLPKPTDPIDLQRTHKYMRQLIMQWMNEDDEKTD